MKDLTTREEQAGLIPCCGAAEGQEVFGLPGRMYGPGDKQGRWEEQPALGINASSVWITVGFGRGNGVESGSRDF